MGALTAPRIYGTCVPVEAQAQLARGERLTEILKQDQYRPLDVVKQVVSIFAGTKGFTDNIKVDEVHPFLEGMLRYLDTSKGALIQKISEEKALNDAVQEQLLAALKEYKEQFMAKRSAA